MVHGSKVKSAITGTSQSGRFIRSMIALGFNKGEDGRQVFNGAMPHIGGGLMPLNIRFAQPGRAWASRSITITRPMISHSPMAAKSIR